jgi:hypothetical protein
MDTDNKYHMDTDNRDSKDKFAVVYHNMDNMDKVDNTELPNNSPLSSATQ